VTDLVVDHPYFVAGGSSCRRLDHDIQQRRLADSGLASDNQRAASTVADSGDHRVEHIALNSSPAEPH
jgi:hypothetical protein